MSTPPLRFLIVGSGIAGSLLGRELLRLGARVTLCRDSSLPGSSRIAAGLITPITGLRFVKSWNLDRVFPYARVFYREMEELSGKPVFHPLNILRLFKNPEEAGRWQRKTDEAGLREFIVQEWTHFPGAPGLLHEGGGIEITGGGWIDMASLLNRLHTLLERHSPLISLPLDCRDLKITASTARWQDQEFDRVIFCQGYRPENPWFNWLAWKPAQGEILTLRIPGFFQDHIINRGLFVLPLGNDFFRVGATYNWRFLQPRPTPEGRARLESEIRQLISLPYEILDHSAAVRPILRNTLPVIGRHPQHPVLGIFNGLGSKGALTAPFYARHFAEHLVTGQALDPDVDLARND